MQGVASQFRCISIQTEKKKHAGDAKKTHQDFCRSVVPMAHPKQRLNRADVRGGPRGEGKARK